MRTVWILLFLGQLHAQLPEAKPIPKTQVIPLPHHVTSFQWEGRELTAAHFAPEDRRPFWYPIRSSHDPSLTRMGHPHDPLTHSHHNSVWIAHASVNGIDFWGDQAKLGGKITTVEVSREGYEDADEHASMRTVNHWTSLDDGKLQVIETRHTEIRPLRGAASWFMIVDLCLATPPGSKANFGASGFGLIAVRMAKSIGVLDGGGRILNSEGQVNEAAIFRKPARWCDYSGRITSATEGFGGITLMNHPSNPRNPTAFHVRDDGWMGCCLSLDESVEITENRPLRLRYALWVHDGVASLEACQTHWSLFTSLPLPRKL
jgi:hypothetical protein